MKKILVFIFSIALCLSLSLFTISCSKGNSVNSSLTSSKSDVSFEDSSKDSSLVDSSLSEDSSEISEDSSEISDNLSETSKSSSEISSSQEKSSSNSQNEENLKKINEVIKAISMLPDNVTLVDKNAVESARNLYDLLANDLKNSVTNYSKLLNCENQISQLLTNYVVTIYTNGGVVSGATDNGNGTFSLVLSGENQTVTPATKEGLIFDGYYLKADFSGEKVTAVTGATTLYAKFRTKSFSEGVQVNYELNGGYISSLFDLNAYFSIKHVNKSAFAFNSSEVFIYNSQMLSSDIGNSYTYFLKIKISELSNGFYCINEIINSGTALDDAHKNDGTYIFIHPAYSWAYEIIKSWEVGKTLYLNKELPTYQSSTNNDENFDGLLCVPLTSGIVTYYEKPQELPTPFKQGASFEGFYDNASFTGNRVTEINGEINLYAKWSQSSSPLSRVSDVANTNTVDNLIYSSDNGSVSFTSSNPSLYVISNGQGRVNAINQTHKKQTVTITASVNTNGQTQTYSKNITVNPINFYSISSTPVATYFSIGSFSSYMKYNDRYKSNGTYFSDSTKRALDIIYYSFIYLDSQANVSLDTRYLQEVRKLRENKVRIVASVSGVSASSSADFRTICSSDELLNKFVKNLMDLVEANNLDGLDIDWEAVDTTNRPYADLMNKLMKALREEMSSRQQEGGSPYLLSCAVPASSWGLGTERFDFKTLNNYVDYVNLMSYDLHNTGLTSHLSPMYSTSVNGLYKFGCDWGLNKLVELGLSQNKVIIGSAGYGKAYKVTGSLTSGNNPELGISGTLTAISGYEGSFASGTVYGNVISQLISSGRYVKKIEYNSSNQIVGSYLYSPQDNIYVTYDSEEVVKAKYNYAKQKGAGIMCWCYSEDTSDSVINAISSLI